MNILIHGYGKVGKLVEKLVLETQGVKLVGIVSSENSESTLSNINKVDLNKVDVIIDFSTGSAFVSMIKYVSVNNPKVCVVTGTSDWENYTDELTKTVASNNMRFLYGANFSIGTALFIEIASEASKMFNNFEMFDVALLDIHHRKKKDMPSGTAKTIANNVVDIINRKTSSLYGNTNGVIADNQFHVNSIRVGENKGFHELIFDSENEVVKISQQTLSRYNYAHGALKSAQWLITQQKPGYYTFSNYIRTIIGMQH
ncbi:MAG: hypothetical protein KAG96_02145 [Ichthyobacteriaceae bacterium]|nr:hypothetical protein [Ichthyobacteriaceae bacterium]